MKKSWIIGILIFSLLLNTAQQCQPQEYCGDGIANSNEECDGFDLREETCESLGFSGGRLSCTDSCEYDQSECLIIQEPYCGDGVVNQLTEECDFSDLDGATCETFGYEGGELSCTPLCFYDTSQCNNCGFYDDFLSGGVDPTKWIEHTIEQSGYGGFHDEHGSQPLSGIYHVAQTTLDSVIHRTDITALFYFLPGDSFSYDLSYNSVEGEIESWPFVNWIYSQEAWVASQLQSPTGHYTFTLNFLVNSVEFIMVHPDSTITSEIITGINQPYVLTIISHTGRNSLVDFDYSNFKLCAIGDSVRSKISDPELYKNIPKETSIFPLNKSN